MAILAEARAHLAQLRGGLAGLSPTAVSGPDAVALVELGVELERLGAMLRTRFCLRVTRTGAYEGEGHKSAAAWLAGVAGEPVGQAMGVLETAGHLDAAPVVGEAFDRGQLSLAQAKVAAAAGAMDPGAQDELVRSVTQGESYRDLKDRAARVQRRHEGERSLAEREARAHRGRYCRTFQPQEGGVRLEAWLPTAEGARVRSALAQEADRVFCEARAAGVHEPPDRYQADALVRLICGEAGARPQAEVAVRVDAAALRRGAVEGDEVCEIPGVGPIPIAVAKDLLGDALFHLVVTDGVDVATVTSAKRTIRASLRSALAERDPTCAVPGCTATRHLEIDHTIDFSRGGPTELANLVRLCRPHHAMKTYLGYRLEGPPGKRRWVGPTTGPPGETLQPPGAPPTCPPGMVAPGLSGMVAPGPPEKPGSGAGTLAAAGRAALRAGAVR